MNYQTLLNETVNWLFSDLTHIGCVIGAIVVIGAVNGIRLSLNHCKGPYNRRIL